MHNNNICYHVSLVDGSIINSMVDSLAPIQSLLSNAKEAGPCQATNWIS